MDASVAARAANIIASATMLLAAIVLLYSTKKKVTICRRLWGVWISKWLVWIVLYLLLLVPTNQNQPPQAYPIEPAVLALSNLESLLSFYLAWMLFVPGNYKGLSHKHIATILVAGFVASYLVMFFLTSVLGAGALLEQIHKNWTQTLSTLSPVSIGLAASLRFRDPYGLVVGLTYAIAQPVAFVAIDPSLREFPDVALTSGYMNGLAILKIIWGACVARYLVEAGRAEMQIVGTPADTFRFLPWPTPLPAVTIAAFVVTAGFIVAVAEHGLRLFFDILGILGSILLVGQMVIYVWRLVTTRPA